MSTKIPPLVSGGLLTNYSCTSSCRHCLYRCSPHRAKDYITPEQTERNLAAVRDNGCRSLHIGGGEPFVKPKALKECLKPFRGSGVGIDYIETNASWAADAVSRPEDLLEELLDLGVDTLLISISPFHNESVPYAKTERLIRACRSAGMGIFPWVEGFIGDLSTFDTSISHSMEEFENRFGTGYLKSLPRRYWINMRGRALDTYEPFMTPRPLDELLKDGSKGCAELTDTSNFHVDLYGSYIPGLCPGLGVSVEALGAPLPAGTSPVLTILMTEGPSGLLDYARRDFGFEPKDEYVSKCRLCEEIRGHIVGSARKAGTASFPELAPREYYSLFLVS